MERPDDRACDYRSSLPELAAALGFSRDVPGNFLAALLERWRPGRDVADTIKARRSDFSDGPAFLPGFGGAERKRFR